MADKIVYSTKQDEIVGVRKHDIGTPERHAKGDIEEYQPRDSKEKFARARRVSIIERYERIGYIDEKQAIAARLLGKHYGISSDPSGPALRQWSYGRDRKGRHTQEDIERHAARYAESKRIWRDICRLLDYQMARVMMWVCVEEKALSGLDGMTKARKGNANHCRLTCALDIAVDYFNL